MNLSKKLKSLSICLTSDLMETDRPMFKIAKLFGLWPVVIDSTKETQVFTARWSGWWYIYGVFVFVVLGLLGVSFLIDEISAGIHAVRLTINTNRVVSLVDLVSLIIMSGIAIFYSPFHLLHMEKFYKNIFQVDNIIGYKDATQYRKSNMTFLMISYGYLTILGISDNLYWVKKFGSLRFLRKLFVFALFHFIVATVGVFFASTVLLMARRLKRLNHCLELYSSQCLLPNVHFAKKLQTSLKLNEYDSIKTNERENLQSGSISKFLLLHEERPASMWARNELDLNILMNNNPVEFIRTLCEVHGLLCDAAHATMKGFGLMLTLIFLSIVFYLIQTPYFIIFEILHYRVGLYFFILSVMWLVYHLGCLLIIIEPCHKVNEESNNLIRNVCNMLVYPNMEEVNRNQLQLFSIQLLQRPVTYSLGGLLNMGRPLIPGICGAITTYLVILLQFSNK